MAIDCEGFEGAVLDFLYGELPVEKRGDIDAHSATCPECAQLHRELTEARQIAHALPARVAPPRELDERILIAARAAADQRDVGRHPLRGGALHAAAAVLLASLLGVSGFAIGVHSTRPKPLPPGPITAGDPPDEETPSKPPIVDINHNRPGPLKPTRPRDGQAVYQEELLGLAKDKLAKKTPGEALTIFRGVYATGGRSPLALDAHLGMAKALRDLNKIDEALSNAESARDENDEWGIQDEVFDKEANALVRELRAIKERLR